MRAATLLLTIALAMTISGAPTHSDSGLSTGTTTQELAERGGCYDILGFNFGGPCYGSWGRDRFLRYKNQCGRFGWDVGARPGPAGGLAFQWGPHWIGEADWVQRGDFWLPADVGLWGTLGPAPWEHRGIATPDCFRRYKDACHVRGFEPHYYWDAGRGGYFYFFDGRFHYEADFDFTPDGRYWIPRAYFGHWRPGPPPPPGPHPGPPGPWHGPPGPGPHSRA